MSGSSYLCRLSAFEPVQNETARRRFTWNDDRRARDQCIQRIVAMACNRTQSVGRRNRLEILVERRRTLSVANLLLSDPHLATAVRLGRHVAPPRDGTTLSRSERNHRLRKYYHVITVRGEPRISFWGWLHLIFDFVDQLKTNNIITNIINKLLWHVLKF